MSTDRQDPVRQPAERRAITANKQAIPNMTMITQRPTEVDDRAVPGHWEDDLIMGKNNASAIATLVERTSRFVILVRLSYDHCTDRVAYGLTTATNRLPALLNARSPGIRAGRWRSMQNLPRSPACPCFFCDPHAPWQRGTNEKTNGLLREYFPKKIAKASPRCSEAPSGIEPKVTPDQGISHQHTSDRTQPRRNLWSRHDKTHGGPEGTQVEPCAGAVYPRTRSSGVEHGCDCGHQIGTFGLGHAPRHPYPVPGHLQFRVRIDHPQQLN